MYTLDELRTAFLEFHAHKGHTIIPSSPLVPKEDPTVLFNTAGMQPMVPYLTGQVTYPHGITRIANSQKCIRTDDIDEVGDNRHCTFFEMLGNWSLNDYFKDEIIPWSMEFLVDPKWLGMDINRIYTTVYRGSEEEHISPDTESIALWEQSYKKYNFTGSLLAAEPYSMETLQDLYPQLFHASFEHTTYIVCDFDGVIADSRDAVVSFLMKQVKDGQFVSAPFQNRQECITWLDLHFSQPKQSDSLSLTPYLHQLIQFCKKNAISIPYFKDFVETLTQLKNTKIAIVTDNLKEFVEYIIPPDVLEKMGVEYILDNDSHNSKVEKMQTVASKWGVDVSHLYYITDTVRDDLELSQVLAKNHIFVRPTGFNTEKTILSHFPYHQILFKPEDVLCIFTLKLGDIFSVDEIKSFGFIPRIRLLAGSDNWWGLPYRGPCGPCSEMYYVLNHNPIHFEEELFPHMTAYQVIQFIEDQIVEIGNNVFMMYEGEKDGHKEPQKVKPLGMKNVDTGLGFERFAMAVNGYSTVYELDIFHGVLDVISRYEG